MNPIYFLKYHFLTAILIIILNGCVISPPDTKRAPFQDLALKTFSSGLSHISERYIEPILVSDLAIEGLRGLESIDERLKIKVKPLRIIVKFSRNVSKEYIKPSNESVKHWSETMASVLNFARAHSSAIRDADQEIIFAAIFDGSVSLLDFFSRYSGATEADDNRIKRSGFGGIGIVLKNQQDGALIVTVIESSPAFFSGIKVGDLVTHIDGTSIKGWRKKKLENTVRGEIGAFVKITLTRNKIRHLQYSVKRAKITLPTVKSKRSNGILYLKVSGFNDDTARQIGSKVRDAVKPSNNSIYGMILDLRGNIGGVLTQAIKVVDLFLKNGKILTTRGRHPSSRQEYLATEDDILAGKPLIVLINGGSASSSEIVAAALQDHKRAVIVGTSSYGKGSVQSVTRLPNGGELTLTWSKFVTPSGYMLHNLGIPPNICTYKQDASAEQILAGALSKAKRFIRLLQNWQKVKDDDMRERIALRKNCQPSQILNNIDILIAKKLISDTALYSQIRDTSPSAFTNKNL